jgi:hypothetical protein
MAQAVECLLCKLKAPYSNSSPKKKEKKAREGAKEEGKYKH